MKANVNFIVMCTNEPQQAVIKEVLAGVEEEGLYCGFSREDNSMDSISLAYQAAGMSSSGVGIGVENGSVAVAIQSGVQPVWIDCSHITPRMAGQNAARLVKKRPLLQIV